MSGPKCHRGSTQLAWSAAQLAILLLLQQAIAAAQPQAGLAARSAAAAPLDQGAATTTSTTSSTTTSTVIVEQREEKTTVPAANAAAANVGPAAAGSTQPASWIPAVTRPPTPSALTSSPLAPAVGRTASTTPPLTPAAAAAPAVSSNSGSSSSGVNTGNEKYSNMAATNGANAPLGNTTTIAAGAGARTGPTTPVLGRQPAAVVAAVTEAAGTEAGGGAGAAKNANSKIWKPTYPFPQCANTTLSYDISFVGALKRIQVGSVKYAYHRFGPLNPSAPQPPPFLLSPDLRSASAPVVFISGWGTSMYMWPVPLIQRLADTREVIIFDNMRTGFTTDSSNAPLTIPMMADSTAALIDKLGLQQPSIWGWSLGGIVAYALLALHSSKVGNVVIAAGSPGGPDALLPPVPVTQQILNLQQNYTALLPFLFADGVKSPGVCGFYAAYNSFYASRFTTLSTPLGENSLREQSQAVVKFFKDSTVIDRLRGTTNRVLILHGVQDQLLPVRNALLGVWKLLGAWMMQFPGEGHGFPFSYIQGVINTTLQFFSLASPLTSAEILQWDTYGDTAATRGTGVDTTLVVKAAAVGRDR